MSLLTSRMKLGGHMPHTRFILAAAVAALVATGITVGLVLSLDGTSTPETGGLLPLAPDTDVAPGTVQLEPGDTPPPLDLEPIALGGPAAISAVGPGISVGEALASSLDEPLLVNGNIFIANDTTRLCSALAESFPPQCGGDSIQVTGLDVTTLDLERQNNVAWTNAYVQVLGRVVDGVLVVDNTTLASSGSLPLPLPTDGEGLGPAINPADATSLSLSGVIRSGQAGPIAFGAEELSGFDPTVALLYDFQTNTLSGRLHVPAFEVTGIMQGEGPQSVRVTMTVAATDLVTERVALPDGQIGRIAIPIEATRPVAVSLTSPSGTTGATTPLVGELSLNLEPDNKGIFGSVALHPTDLPSALGFVTDLLFILDFELTAEQHATFLAHLESK